MLPNDSPRENMGRKRLRPDEVCNVDIVAAAGPSMGTGIESDEDGGESQSKKRKLDGSVLSGPNRTAIPDAEKSQPKRSRYIPVTKAAQPSSQCTLRRG